MRIKEGSVGQEDVGPLTPWKEADSRGLDTWFELPGCAIRGGLGGEPGGSHDYSSLMEDYLATLDNEEANAGYCAWLKHVLARLKVREEG